MQVAVFMAGNLTMIARESKGARSGKMNGPETARRQRRTSGRSPVGGNGEPAAAFTPVASGPILG